MAGKRGDRGPDKKPRKGSPRRGRLPSKNVEKKPTKVQQTVLIERIVEGISVAEIAAEFKCTVSAVYLWLGKPEVAAEIHNQLQLRLEAARQRIQAGAVATANALIEVACGKKKGSPQQVMAARDVLNRAGVEAGEIVKHTGSLESLSDEELEARAEARRK